MEAIICNNPIETVTCDVRGTHINIPKEIALKIPKLKETVGKPGLVYINCSPEAFHAVVDYLSFPNHQIPEIYHKYMALLGLVNIQEPLTEAENCKYNNCTKLQGPGSNYCVNHTCVLKSCDKKIGSSTLKCCLAHKCQICNEHVGMINMEELCYCFNHLCNFDNCKDKKHLNFSYCSKHICILPFCNEKVSSNMSNSCHEHKYLMCDDPVSLVMIVVAVFCIILGIMKW